ncbi:YecH family metal-binding protein [Vibrio sp. SCSIO 43136]|uniref:YecH family metal-binding protein n=1 Tax=Vibrio sp. SCSIO 43136 TaxID=2819101 RepID=UPI0020756055|nr:YecH family metal-binding protein [Vibrio sp. SCSIO 43136]USD65386.1 YecH family protein [Vibrio sp. SCSIO 43136]
MSDSVHGHDLMALIATSPLTLEQLKAQAAQQFGPQARFHTCKMSDLSLEQLLEFLISRSKVVETEAGLMLNKDRMCNH